MLRRSSRWLHDAQPHVTNLHKGRQSVSYVERQGFQWTNERIDDLGPGWTSIGIFDPQWRSPFIPVFEMCNTLIKRGCYFLQKKSDAMIKEWPKESLYRLRRLVTFAGVRPIVRDNAFIAPSAVVIGDVTVGRKSTIGYNAVIRGDLGPIKIGESACINDKVVLHGPVKIGKWTTVDPMCVVENSEIHSCSMVGSASVVSAGCRIESGAMLCAASVLRPGTTIPSGEIWSGNPAMKLGTLSEEEKGYIIKAAKHMVLLNLEHTATWEVTYEDHENYRIAREVWAQWTEKMIEGRVKPFYSRAGPKDTGRAQRSPLEAMQGRLDGATFEAHHIEGGNKGQMC